MEAYRDSIRPLYNHGIPIGASSLRPFTGSPLPLAAMATAYDEKAGHKEPESFDDEKLDSPTHDLHSIIEGSEGVTQHDLNTLRQVSDKLPASAWLVVFVEFAERYVLLLFLP